MGALIPWFRLPDSRLLNRLLMSLPLLLLDRGLVVQLGHLGPIGLVADHPGDEHQHDARKKIQAQQTEHRPEEADNQPKPANDLEYSA